MIVIVSIVILGAGYLLLLPHLNKNKPVTLVPDALFGWKFPVTKFPTTGSGGQVAYSDIRDPGGIPSGLPVRLQIPVIGVDSLIEDALITSDGRMDVPAGSVNVAWFALGPHPGDTGSAVIGGHFGISNGVPWVFYNLDKLRVGDKIYILDDKNETLAFQVRAINSFDRDADATTVFTSTDGLAHLNLITCEGIWNQVNGMYPQRLVVFTDAIPSEGPISVNPTSTTPTTTPEATPSPTPASTPTPTPPATPSPTPVAIPATPSPLPETVPSLTTTSPTSGQTLVQSAKSLFATPVNAIITSTLVIGIGVMAVLIIW